MRPILTPAFATTLILAGAAQADDAALRSMAKEYFEPIPLQAPMLENNVISRDRVDLGAKLFFDPRMSRSGLFSCQSCHNVGIGGVDGLETSVGHGWQAGPRNAPTMLNAVFKSPSSGMAARPTSRRRPRGPCRPASR